jgi:hypothetical protein
VAHYDVRELGLAVDLPPSGQRLGMGFLDSILGAAEKLAEPAVLAYGTYLQDKQARTDYRVRRAETAAQLEAHRAQAQVEEARIQAQAPVSAARAEQVGEVVKLAIGGAVLVGAGLVAFKVGKYALEALRR